MYRGDLHHLRHLDLDQTYGVSCFVHSSAVQCPVYTNIVAYIKENFVSLNLGCANFRCFHSKHFLYLLQLATVLLRLSIFYPYNCLKSAESYRFLRLSKYNIEIKDINLNYAKIQCQKEDEKI